MKKKTCKILICISVVWIIATSLFLSYIIGSLQTAQKIPDSFASALSINYALYLLLLFIIYNIPAWILLIIVRIKWNSEKKNS